MDNIEQPNNEEVSQQKIEIGAALKSARLAQGLSIGQVAEHLHLKPKLIEQLENDDYQLDRSLVFTRGYIRAYGKFLELDVPLLMQTFDKLHLPEHVVTRAAHGPLFRNVKGKMFSVKAASIVILSVLAFMIILGWQMGDDETQQKQATSVISPYTMGNSMSIQNTPVVPPPVVVDQPANVAELQKSANAIEQQQPANAAQAQQQPSANVAAQQQSAPSNENTDDDDDDASDDNSNNNAVASSHTTGTATNTAPAAQPNTTGQSQPAAATPQTNTATTNSQTSTPSSAPTSNTTAAPSASASGSSATTTQSAPVANQSNTSSSASTQSTTGSTTTKPQDPPSASQREAAAREKLQEKPEHHFLEWQ